MCDPLPNSSSHDGFYSLSLTGRLKMSSPQLERLNSRIRLKSISNTPMTSSGTAEVLKIVIGGVRYRAQRCGKTNTYCQCAMLTQQTSLTVTRTVFGCRMTSQSSKTFNYLVHHVSSGRREKNMSSDSVDIGRRPHTHCLDL